MIRLLLKKLKFGDSARYWEKRYRKGRSSGQGSYGRLSEFKARFINKFVADNKIFSIIEYGCGDGNQLSLSKYREYVGVDVSQTIISSCQKKFLYDKTKKFYLLGNEPRGSYDLSLSLDVIYHLVEDDVFSNHLKTLFESSKKYVIIYSSNSEELNKINDCIHIRHRKFVDYIEKNIVGWKLQKFLPNEFPLGLNDGMETSFADFFVFSKY